MATFLLIMVDGFKPVIEEYDSLEEAEQIATHRLTGYDQINTFNSYREDYCIVKITHGFKIKYTFH
jgi:hypothetical protein